MLSLRPRRITALALVILGIVACCSRSTHAQVALLMEEPYGFFGTLNPTGHTAVYFARICAETPVKLRRCEAGEQGTVIARYQGIDGYDWVAMPLIPYLYSVENASDVPARADHDTVHRLRNRYHEDHMGYLGHVIEGNFLRGGWTQLVGASYDRRIYAFKFATTQEQDDAVIERLNFETNRSNFNLFYKNCADFSRIVLNMYFPQTFKRNFFPDAGMTTPKQITYKLTRYSRTHPDIHLEVFEIPQVPGYRRLSHANKTVSASLMTTGYVVPIVLLNPYLAGGLFLDYVTRGRFPTVPQHAPVLSPAELATLQFETGGVQSTASPAVQEQNTAATNTLEQIHVGASAVDVMQQVVTANE